MLDQHWGKLQKHACARTISEAHASKSSPRRRSFSSTVDVSTVQRSDIRPYAPVVSPSIKSFQPVDSLCPRLEWRESTKFRHAHDSSCAVHQTLNRESTTGTGPPKSFRQGTTSNSTRIARACIPSRTSSRCAAQKPWTTAMSISRRRRGTDNSLYRCNRKDKHFTSIDGLLASRSSSASSTADLDLDIDLLSSNSSVSSTHSSRKRPSPRPSTSSSPSSSAESTSPPPPMRQRRRSSLPTSYIHIHTSLVPSPHGALTPNRPPLTPNPPSLVNLPVPLPLPLPATSSFTSNSATPHHSKRPSLAPQTLSWTSNETRRLEYAAIDRAHSGIRGFLRRVLPRSCFADGYRRFWDDTGNERGKAGVGRGGDDGDEDYVYADDAGWDARSVRRYRLRLDDDDDDEGGDVSSEKRTAIAGVNSVDSQRRRWPRRVTWASLRAWI